MSDPYEENINFLQKLYDEVSTDEAEIIEESEDSDADERTCEHSDHDTDSEQEITATEETKNPAQSISCGKIKCVLQKTREVDRRYSIQTGRSKWRCKKCFYVVTVLGLIF